MLSKCLVGRLVPSPVAVKPSPAVQQGYYSHHVVILVLVGWATVRLSLPIIGLYVH